MASLGLPILGDPLYPEVIDVAPDDFSAPLQLLAHSLEFDDPISGISRRFVSRRALAAAHRRAVRDHSVGGVNSFVKSC
jgi:tRNA pseudouridine32 synthase/23S rRNA pseudouridine746 synthase